MTMEKLGGNQGLDHRFYCDGVCGDYIDCGEDFYSAIDELKSTKWKTVKNGQYFEHYCPSCTEDGK